MSSTNFCSISSTFYLFFSFTDSAVCIDLFYVAIYTRNTRKVQYLDLISNKYLSGIYTRECRLCRQKIDTVRTCDWYIKMVWIIIGEHTRSRSPFFFLRCTSTVNLQETKTRRLWQRNCNFHLANSVVLLVTSEQLERELTNEAWREQIVTNGHVVFKQGKKKLLSCFWLISWASVCCGNERLTYPLSTVLVSDACWSP